MNYIKFYNNDSVLRVLINKLIEKVTRKYLISIMEIFIDVIGYEIKNYSKIDNYKKNSNKNIQLFNNNNKLYIN